MTAMTRRDLLLLCGLGAGFPWAARLDAATMGAMQRRQAAAAIDHLLLGAADLDRGVEWVETLTGVKATIGGSHPGMGTRNALLSLGGRQYLEIIAPDPAQSAYNFQIDVRKLPEPRLVNWAAVSTAIDVLARTASDAGVKIFGPRDGSRVRPDGKTLQWKTLGVLSDLAGDSVQPVPFFIQWAPESVHPSLDSPQGCRLTGFSIRHSSPAPLVSLLQQLGLDADVQPAERVQLAATLETPKGRIELT
jgi:hypothetical protein